MRRQRSGPKLGSSFGTGVGVDLGAERDFGDVRFLPGHMSFSSNSKHAHRAR